MCCLIEAAGEIGRSATATSLVFGQPTMSRWAANVVFLVARQCPFMALSRPALTALIALNALNALNANAVRSPESAPKRHLAACKCRRVLSVQTVLSETRDLGA